MYADDHLHSEFSDDSREPMENQIKKGIELGLDEMCFTDHVDYGVKRDWDDPKGIEVHTSSWHYGLADMQPGRNILKLYNDLGGKISTMGSDAHRTEFLADHIRDADTILKEEPGFTRIATFEDRNPVFHAL